jgi:hypothetical protein
VFLVRPRISINGKVQKARWGFNTWSLLEGSHALEVWYPWPLNGRACYAALAVDIARSENTFIRYRPRSRLGGEYGKLHVVMSPRRGLLP